MNNLKTTLNQPRADNRGPTGGESNISQKLIDQITSALREAAVDTMKYCYSCARKLIESHQAKSAADIQARRGNDATSGADHSLTWNINESLASNLQKISNQLRVSFVCFFDTEETPIIFPINQSSVAVRKIVLHIHGDPIAGSKNFLRFIEGVVNVPTRAFVSGPHAMSLIAFKLPDFFGDTYVAGAAVDLGTGKVYSGRITPGMAYETLIDEHLVNASGFKLGLADTSRILLLSFMDMAENEEFFYRIKAALQQSIRKSEVYLGGIPSVSKNLLELCAGTFDAVIDIRALSPHTGRFLEPIDICGLVPFLIGTGCHLIDENGRPVDGFDVGRKPICLLASYNSGLIARLANVIKNL